LTHPRTLDESEVRRLARLVAKGCRLFALTATEDGRVELARLRDGGPVPINRFRVDFAPPAPRPAPRPVASAGPWFGHVEPIPFPFRFGLTNRVVDVAFDLGGERLLAATVSGFLHCWTLADGSVEVVPRGEYGGAVVRAVQAVVGVGNGFAVCGRWGEGLAVVHYDWPTRTATLHRLVTDAGSLEAAWYGFPHLNSVVLKVGGKYLTADLGAPVEFAEVQGESSLQEQIDFTQTPRAAVDAARKLLLPPPQVPVLKADDSQTPAAPYMSHESASGRLRVVLPDRDVVFTPTSDGRPRFRTFAPVGQFAGSTLALFATQPQTWSLHDLDHEGATLAEYPPSKFGIAKLSPDGRRFVRQTQGWALRVT